MTFDWGQLGYNTFMAVYTFLMVMVSLYGLHRYVLVVLYYRHRKNVPQPKGQFGELPMVTVQLPMFNERLVAKRIIEKACAIDYPNDRLHIQVLDDSTDHTQDVARQAVADACAKGFDVEYIHRTDRSGYKAGALENGLKTAKGEFVTIFDADFIPDPQMLKRSIHYFTDPKVCVVQTRWDHINRNDSMLTRSQAIFLDGHFAIEHVARNRSARFMSFNGTAGTWRKSAIRDAGGWQHDTLTEDLDLSYRAQLRGWKFIFLPDLTAPAELPPEMNAFKVQQFRWTKGGAQTALKLLPKVMLSKMPLKVKVEAFFHLTSFTLHIYMLLMVLMLLPAILMRSDQAATPTLWRSMFDISVFTLATLSASIFYVASQVELFGDWRNAFKYLPIMMALGVGLTISNAKAIIEALFGRQSEFVRTPKYAGQGVTSVGCEEQTSGEKKKKRRRDWLPWIEMIFGIYMMICTIISLTPWGNSPFTAPFLAMFSFGFFYVSIMSLHAQHASNVAEQAGRKAIAEAAKH